MVWLNVFLWSKQRRTLVVPSWNCCIWSVSLCAESMTWKSRVSNCKVPWQAKQTLHSRGRSLFFCVFCCCFCLVQFDSRSFNSVRHRKKISKTDMDWIKLNGLVFIQDNNLSNCAKQPCLSFNANFSSYSLAEIPPSDCLQIMVCSCAMSSNSVWLQIIFCSSTCVNETTLF